MDKKGQMITIFFSFFLIIMIITLISIESSNLSTNKNVNSLVQSFTIPKIQYYSYLNILSHANSITLSNQTISTLNSTLNNIYNSYFNNLNVSTNLLNTTNFFIQLPSKPSHILSYVPVTFSNLQNTPTLSPFQQMVNASYAVYGNYSNSELSNVEFFYFNGTVIPSWLESYNANGAMWWIKIGSIPASSSITVYMGFAPKTTNLLNTVNDGEAPQLSSTYGEYDDGASVFNAYSNFAGTTLPSTFTSYVGSNAALSVSNGLHLTVNNDGCTDTWAGVVYNNPINSANSIVETYSSGIRGPGPEDVGIYTANSDTTGGYAGVADTWGWGYGTISGGYGNIGNPFDISSGTGIASIYWIGQGNEGIGWNYDFVSSTDGSETWSSSLYPSIQTGQCSPGANMEYYWFRVRAYPPNGVMPNAYFGGDLA
jgi:hypothetical protein